MEFWHLLSEVVLLLAASLLAGGILTRLGQNPLVGYLLVGMALGGPGSFGLIGSEKTIEAVAELGVSLLLFGLGLEFSWSRLMSLGKRTLVGGVLQVILTLAVAAGVAMAFGVSTRSAVVVGAMVALSSTACVLRTLIDLGEIDSAHGRSSLAVLLVQDIAVVPLAVVVTVLSGDEGGAIKMATQVGRIFLMGSILAVSLYLILDVIAARFIGELTLEHNRELSVLLAVVTGIGSAWAAHRIGVSPALGAFLAGMFLGSSPFATQVRADVSSFRAVLLTLFFGTAGMAADPGWILNNLLSVLATVALIILGKGLLVALIMRLLAFPVSTAVAAGVCLAQIGEFAFVLGAIAHSGGVLDDRAHLLLISSAIVALAVSPFLIPLAPRIGSRVSRWLGAQGPEKPAAPRENPNVVVIGFGPAGRLAAASLAGRNCRVLVIDLNQDGVHQAEEFGFDGLIGDATHKEVLEHAGLGGAEVVVITIPNRSAAMTVLAHVRRLAPESFVVVRSRYEKDTHDFTEAGAHVVVGDEEEVGKALALRVGELIDLDE